MTTLEFETDRLLIQRLVAGDAQEFFGYRSQPEVTRFQGWEPQSVTEALELIETQQIVVFGADSRWVQRAIRLRDSGRLIGDAGVRLHGFQHLAQTPQAEFGITVAPQHQRNGYAVEAVSALIGCLFEEAKVHRVFASVDPRNTGSLRLMSALRLRREAHLRESLWFKGEWVDDVIFAILRREWPVG